MKTQTFAEYARKFLSIQAQDFIEDARAYHKSPVEALFLSIQAQDFIEDD